MLLVSLDVELDFSSSVLSCGHGAGRCCSVVDVSYLWTSFVDNDSVKKYFTFVRITQYGSQRWQLVVDVWRLPLQYRHLQLPCLVRQIYKGSAVAGSLEVVR